MCHHVSTHPGAATCSPQPTRGPAQRPARQQPTASPVQNSAPNQSNWEVHPSWGQRQGHTWASQDLAGCSSSARCSGKLDLAGHWSPVGPGTVATEGRAPGCSGATLHTAKGAAPYGLPDRRGDVLALLLRPSDRRLPGLSVSSFGTRGVTPTSVLPRRRTGNVGPAVCRSQVKHSLPVNLPYLRPTTALFLKDMFLSPGPGVMLPGPQPV